MAGLGLGGVATWLARCTRQTALQGALVSWGRSYDAAGGRIPACVGSGLMMPPGLSGGGGTRHMQVQAKLGDSAETPSLLLSDIFSDDSRNQLTPAAIVEQLNRFIVVG